MKLKEGESAPDFMVGKTKLHQIPGRKIVFFFPKAFTPGCTKEACAIQDTFEDIKELGINTVIGVSMDDQKTLEKFKESYGLEYTFVSDKQGEISKQYGVYKNFLLTKISDRVTFIINEDNKIEKRVELGITGRKSKVGLENHGKEILQLLNDL